MTTLQATSYVEENWEIDLVGRLRYLNERMNIRFRMGVNSCN